jgi:hypothetical protein
MTLDTYGHVFAELAGQKRESADALIREAHASNVRPQAEAAVAQAG